MVKVWFDRLLFCWKTCHRIIGCLGCGAKGRQRDTEPLLLDMGQFWVPSISSMLGALAAKAATNRQESQQCDLSRVTTAAIAVIQDFQASPDSTVAQSVSVQPGGTRAATAAAAVAVLCGELEVDTLTRHSLRLHSITARVHYERSMAWTSQLNFPGDVQKMAKGYFEAPGGLQHTVSVCLCNCLSPVLELLPTLNMETAIVCYHHN